MLAPSNAALIHTINNVVFLWINNVFFFVDKILHLPRFNEMSVGFPDFIETNRIQSEIKVVTTSAKFSFVKEMILMEQRGVL